MRANSGPKINQLFVLITSGRGLQPRYVVPKSWLILGPELALKNLCNLGLLCPISRSQYIAKKIIGLEFHATGELRNLIG